MKVLIKSENEFQDFSSSSEFSNTTELIWNESGLTKFPLVVTEMPQLKKLSLRENFIETIPDEISKLSNTLTEFDIALNKVKEIPKSIGKLKKLVTFRINDNHLEKVPSEIGDCNLLQFWEVNHNSLTVLPESIKQLLNLQIVDFSYNKFATVPHEFKYTAKIDAMNFESNIIDEIPTCLPKLRNLYRLNLKKNKLSDGQKNLLKRDFKWIKEMLL